MKKIFLLLLAGALIMMTNSCSDDDETVETLTVASVYGFMNYMYSGQRCYLIKENGKGDWKAGFVEGGFPYEPGNEYVIKVTKVIPDPNLMDAITYYKYESIVSKVKKDSEGIDPQMIYKGK